MWRFAYAAATQLTSPSRRRLLGLDVGVISGVRLISS